MKTLLIDNFDSFIWNLFQLIARISGSEPSVIKNNEPGWAVSELGGYDNVVISPGPGNPTRVTDFGLCRSVLQSAAIPVLGVCLGHQGLSWVEGASVELAPVPRHGNLSQIFHDRLGLFEGIPSPFKAVRYHSLAVYELPSHMEAIAVAEDDVLMAVRHRFKPLWGVQFHPESIATEHGEILLRNFFQLTTQYHTDISTRELGAGARAKGVWNAQS
jgi:para-aminobenzoate synthetase